MEQTLIVGITTGGLEGGVTEGSGTDPQTGVLGSVGLTIPLEETDCRLFRKMPALRIVQDFQRMPADSGMWDRPGSGERCSLKIHPKGLADAESRGDAGIP